MYSRCILPLMALACAASALAGPILTNTWYEFGFDPTPGHLAAGCQPADPTGVPFCRVGINSTFLDTPPWTFNVASPVRFTITDAVLSGDFFDVFDFSALVGSTPSVPLFVGCGLDPSICVVTPGISHAIFLLPSGSHSITVNVHPAQLLGEGFFRVDAVPEPATFGTALLLIASLYGYRRFQKAMRG